MEPAAATARRCPKPMQGRVQAAVLLQFVEGGTACRPTTARICPGADRRDLEVALENLIGTGSIDGPPRVAALTTLVELAEDGRLTLTAHGRRRQDGDSAA